MNTEQVSNTSPTSSKKFFEAVNAKAAFLLGLAAGIGAMALLGFFVMLTMFLGQGEAGSILGGGINPTPTLADAGPNPGAVPTTTPTVNLQVSDNDHAQGPADAKVTIIEFSDIQCPFCQRFHPTLKQALKDYPNDVRWVYKHFPLDSIHPQARPAAEASECLAEQKGDDGFFAYLDALFAQQNLLDRDLYISEAKKLGANESQFTACLDSGQYAQRVETDSQTGLSAGVRGTPGSIINGQLVSGAVSYDQLKAIIEQNL